VNDRAIEIEKEKKKKENNNKSSFIYSVAVLFFLAFSLFSPFVTSELDGTVKFFARKQPAHFLSL